MIFDSFSKTSDINLLMSLFLEENHQDDFKVWTHHLKQVQQFTASIQLFNESRGWIMMYKWMFSLLVVVSNSADSRMWHHLPTIVTIYLMLGFITQTYQQYFLAIYQALYLQFTKTLQTIKLKRSPSMKWIIQINMKSSF